MGHNCILCGAELPNRKGGRCYCKPCGEYMRAERLREGNEERKVLRVLHEIEPKPPEKRKVTLKKADMAYCKKCDYHGRFTEEYLCNYFCLTGKLRGCKAGVGCDKRHIATNADNTFGYRTCKRCGAPFIGTKDANYCIECRREVCRENAKKAHEARWKKEGTE